MSISKSGDGDDPMRNFLMAWRYRLRPLSREQVRLRMGSGKSPDCASCQETCCSGPRLVPLRLLDVARLHDAGLGWAMEPPPAASNRLPLYKERPDLQSDESLDVFKRLPILKRTMNDRCVFLDSHGRCSIYSIRPVACRSFPFRLSGDLQGIEYNRRGCKNPSVTQDDGATELHVHAALEEFNSKTRDQVFLEYGRAELERLGLGPYLPELEGEASKESA